MKYPLFIAASAAILLGGCSTMMGEDRAMDSQMPAGSMATTADMNMMMSCKRMSNTDMMRNNNCANMMKMFPDMMKMSSMEMEKMSSCMKMTDEARMADQSCASMMDMRPM